MNELGLPNDGYDYGRHLKTMGGGRFIAASGEVGNAFPGDGIYELPEDPEYWKNAKTGQSMRGEGQGLLRPVVDAITLSADCMDEDMEEALFGNEGDEGDEGEGRDGEEFEELNDDFILQAGRELDSEEEAEGAGEGGGGGFDFEAHMAMLIAKSEKSLGWAPARGWEDGELEKLQQLMPHKGLEGYDTDDEDEDEEEAGAMRESAAAMRRHRLWEARAETGSGAAAPSKRECVPVKDGFEDLLAEYNEDEIGELEDPEEEGANTRGFVDVRGEGEEVGGPGGAYIEHILDDFLRAKIAETDEEEEHADGRGETPRRKSLGLFTSNGGLAEEEREEATEEWEDEGGEEIVTAGGAGDTDDMEQFIVKHNYLGVSDCVGCGKKIKYGRTPALSLPLCKMAHTHTPSPILPSLPVRTGMAPPPGIVKPYSPPARTWTTTPALSSRMGGNGRGRKGSTTGAVVRCRACLKKIEDPRELWPWWRSRRRVGCPWGSYQWRRRRRLASR